MMTREMMWPLGLRILNQWTLIFLLVEHLVYRNNMENSFMNGVYAYSSVVDSEITSGRYPKEYKDYGLNY